MSLIKAPTISAGIISADLMNLQKDIDVLEQTETQALHFDIMDGSFAPMMTVGSTFVKGVKTKLLKDVHLMVVNPLESVEEYVKAGADLISFHIEATDDPMAVLKKLGDMTNQNDPDLPIVRGVAINPGTPASELEPLLNDLEFILVLAVDPTVKGMPFDDNYVGKFNEVKALAENAGNDILVGIDGGIKKDNIEDFAKLKADILVSGSAIFKNKEIKENLDFMYSALKR